MTARAQIRVRGMVQGVGFRPYVYSAARSRSLRGRVFNDPSGVVIDLEGEERAIEELVDEIRRNPPPLSRIESIERGECGGSVGYRDFRIAESAPTGETRVPIPADTGTCDDCLRELFDPRDRRYRYPFLNCTRCGPRFTVVEGVPYDRARTTMRDFPMCASCREEYENPLDRRFHAEPIACPECGPRLRLVDARGTALDGETGQDLLDRVRSLLLDGRIVAIKGLGGYHLACDALDGSAVARLRRRKVREEKPFALMAPSVSEVRQFCLVSAEEEELLVSMGRPIVLLTRRPEAEIPGAVAPRLRTLGFMLPYTPLHHLLLAGLDRPLVMTSGNRSEEPICYRDDEALRRLGGISDYFLVHDRRIHVRADDSVARVVAGRPAVLRRSRGYAPAPIGTSFDFVRPILAVGAELKSTFCLARGRHAFVSHHIGDLENLETLRSFTEGIEHFKGLFDLRPEVAAYDLHPEYLSTKHALALDDVEIAVGVQHHHAHVASCLADNGVDGEVIGVAMDGLGFGADGRFWGGEFFVADFASAERIAHLDAIPMPGGAKAIREPWRMAAVYLHRALGRDFEKLSLPFVESLPWTTWAALRSMMESGTNCPETTSMGRLFDALSSLLGLRQSVSYEGQAAVELEAIADPDAAGSYEFAISGEGVIRAEPVIRQAVADVLDGRPASEVSAKFHLGVMNLITAVARRAREERRLDRVALSGGVFQNRFLTERVRHSLESERFEVLMHGRVPPNDGGISLGQAAVANARLAAGRL
ncbi:MAG TPA: carbamoyltransferase HypF [Vicinamibacteria bacterium]|nr:carbamoyltransferase HypF [Vicinamibacteria bacterium]